MNLTNTFIFILLLAAINLKAQNSYELKVSTSDVSQNILNKYKYQNKLNELSEAQLIVNNLIREIHNAGYLLARIESNEVVENQINYYISIGPPFEWMKLSAGNLDPLLLRKVAYREGNFNQRRFNYRELSKLENSILSYAENNGYPFASLNYDSLKIEDQQISSSLNLNLGPLINYDSLDVKGDVIKRSFLESYLGIQPGEPYEMDRVQGSVQRINSLPFLRLIGPPEISYQNEEASISYVFDKRRINTIDGIIGFLPNSGPNSGLLITGQFDMELYNPFQTGKHIGIHWRSPSQQSQMLHMLYEHPHIFKSPVSFATDFNFLKQDTTFSKLNFNVDVDLQVGASGRMAVFTEFIESNLLSTAQYENATVLPEFADISNTLYGLSFTRQTWDDPILPTRGMYFFIAVGLGNKTIKRNIDLPDELYAGVDFESVQYKFDLNSQQFFNLKPRWNMKIAIDGGWIENDNLFRNDAYRLGGLNSIRGFDENFYFATRFVKSTFENRYFIDSSSYLLLFADFGYLDGFTASESSEPFIGFGTGISFDTGRGIFNLVYALGTSKSVGSLDLNRSKIHFGFTTRF